MVFAFLWICFGYFAVSLIPLKFWRLARWVLTGRGLEKFRHLTPYKCRVCEKDLSNTAWHTRVELPDANCCAECGPEVLAEVDGIEARMLRAEAKLARQPKYPWVALPDGTIANRILLCAACGKRLMESDQSRCAACRFAPAWERPVLEPIKSPACKWCGRMAQADLCDQCIVMGPPPMPTRKGLPT